MKRVLIVVLLTPLLVIVTYFSVKSYYSMRPKKLRDHRPFTATIHEKRFNSGGELGYEEVFLCAYRSDGSEARVYDREFPDKKKYETKVIFDTKRRQTITIDLGTDSLTTYAISENDINSRSSRVEKCLHKNGGKIQTILGIQAVLVETGSTLAQGKAVALKSWEAPSLSCFPIRQEFTFYEPGVPNLLTIREVVSISYGEPRAALYEIPPHLVERSPLQVQSEYARRYGQPCPQCGTSGEHLEKAYKSRHMGN